MSDACSRNELLTAARIVSQGRHTAAIALPGDDEHRKLVSDIGPAPKSSESLSTWWGRT